MPTLPMAGQVPTIPGTRVGTAPGILVPGIIALGITDGTRHITMVIGIRTIGDGTIAPGGATTAGIGQAVIGDGLVYITIPTGERIVLAEATTTVTTGTRTIAVADWLPTVMDAPVWIPLAAAIKYRPAEQPVAVPLVWACPAAATVAEAFPLVAATWAHATAVV